MAALLLPGCEGKKAPAVDSEVKYTSRGRVDLTDSGLPVLANGNTKLIEVPGARLEHDPRLKDALTALGACVDEAIGCVSPDKRSLDECVRVVPKCTTDTPWDEETACCPVACSEGYAALRDAGMEDFEAFRQTLFIDKTCMPGLTEILARGRR